VNRRVDYFIHRLKSELGLYLRISSAIFLFVLFFQPFPISHLNLNNHIILVAGLGGIVFVALVLARVLIILISENNTIQAEKKALPSGLKETIIFLVCAISFVFYLRYAAEVGITPFILFKIALISLSPPVALSIMNTITELREKVEAQMAEKNDIRRQVERLEEETLSKTVEFRSDNSGESLKLGIGEIAFIRSADNYVEIVYREGLDFRKKLIRNTLKNIEQQIRPNSFLIRCHRICIVNLHFAETLERIDHSYWLKIKGFNERLPVSRQYLLKLREALRDE
jgi:DNA-binding LytR/AlgR family response regulator